MASSIEIPEGGFTLAGQENIDLYVEFFETGDDLKETGRSVFIGKEEWARDTFAISNAVVRFFGELMENYPKTKVLMTRYGIEYREKG